MNNIYLDYLFLINFITDYITLLCTAKLSSVNIYRKHIITASIIGGLYACFCTIYSNHWINHPVIQLSCAILLCVIAFHTQESIFRCTITFIFISSIFGGLLSPFVLHTEYTNYLLINSKALLITFAIVYFLLSHFYRQSRKQTSQAVYQVEITVHNKSIRLKALRDTGNELYDPISNLPILIVEQKQLEPLIPELKESEFTKDVYEQFCILNTSSRLYGKFRLIPCQSISGKDVLLGFIPDHIIIDGKPAEMIVAYTNNKLSTNDRYQGIY